jgi:hypothetical protein
MKVPIGVSRENVGTVVAALKGNRDLEKNFAAMTTPALLRVAVALDIEVNVLQDMRSHRYDAPSKAELAHAVAARIREMLHGDDEPEGDDGDDHDEQDESGNDDDDNGCLLILQGRTRFVAKF